MMFWVFAALVGFCVAFLGLSVQAVEGVFDPICAILVVVFFVAGLWASGEVE